MGTSSKQSYELQWRKNKSGQRVPVRIPLPRCTHRQPTSQEAAAEAARVVRHWKAHPRQARRAAISILKRFAKQNPSVDIRSL